MQLIRLRTLLKAGRAIISKYGHIDDDSDIEIGRAAFVDYDSPKDVMSVLQVNRVFRRIGIRYESLRYHRTRRGFHLTAKLCEKLSLAELIALQILLGDDPYRAAFNLMRAICIRKYGCPQEWKQRANIIYDRKIRD